MAKVDPKDFLLNTDYELDKIILVKTGSFVETIKIPHNLSFTPLVFGIWSTDSDFSSSNQLGPYFNEEAFIGNIPPLNVTCTSLSDGIRLTAYGENKTTTTIFYRVYGFQNPESQDNTPATSKLAHSFMINTDYNYRKLMTTGIFTQSKQTFQHNLGYIPQVMAWIQYKEIPGVEYSKGITQVTDISYFNDYYLEVTPTEIKLSYPELIIDKCFWRIYYDET